MNEFIFLVPISIGLGLIGLISFLWALRNNQYEDLDGAVFRVLEDEDKPIINQSVSKKKKNRL